MSEPTTTVETHGASAVADSAIAGELGGDGKLTRGGASWSLFEGARNPYIILVTIYMFSPYVASIMVGDPVKGQAVISQWSQYQGWIVMLTAPLLGASIDQLGRRKFWLGLIVAAMVPMMVALWFLYIDFMIGPIYHSMTKIDEDVMSAASVLGANPIRTFFTVVLPLTRPGLMAGSLFIVVLGLGEFFTERVIGGAQNPMLAGLVLRQVDIFQWASASAMAVLLTFMTLVTVSIMLRFFDLKKI